MEPDQENQEPVIDPTIDPYIKPENLVVQEGQFAGAVNAFETERGTALDDNGEKKDIPDSEQPYIVEGLPVIGAYAEKAAREDPNFPANTEMSSMKDKEKLYDKAGTDAMAAEVKKRAMASIPEITSDETREEFGEIAATKFREELDARLAERKAAKDAEKQAAQEAANAEVRAMIDKLKNGAPFSEVVRDVPDPSKATEEELRKFVESLWTAAKTVGNSEPGSESETAQASPEAPEPSESEEPTGFPHTQHQTGSGLLT